VGKAEVGWIIETKGREFEGTDEKAAHMERWCREVSVLTGGHEWRYVKVAQPLFYRFDRQSPAKTLSGLLAWRTREQQVSMPPSRP
jgi:type III restriction enzyme